MTEATKINWREMSRSTDSRELDTVTGFILETVSRTFVSKVQTLVEDELYVLATDAQKTADCFWEMNEEVRETGDSSQQGYFGTRARIVGNTLDAHWYKNRFVASKGGSDKKRVLSTHIKKGRDARYPASAFKGARGWEKEAIDVTEDRYALLRKRSEALAKVRRALAEYERLLDKCYRS